MVDLVAAEETFRNALAWVCLRGAGVVFAVIALWWLCKVAGEPIARLWRSLTAVGRAVVCALLLIGIIYGGSKTNNVPPNMNQPLPQMQQGGASFQTGFTGLIGLSGIGNLVNLVNPVQTTGEDIARGYRAESVATNAAPFAAMPPNAVEYARWSLRGGRETWFPLDFGDFVFPLGTNSVSRMRVLSGGMVETLPGLNGPGFICAAREHASLVPGVSFFWSADEGGSKVLRWESVFAERDGTGEYTAEMRLFPNGDFTTRSNEVETVYRRVNPDDWDDDGIHNERDLNPTICNGDFFGVGNALPANANPDAYYWLDLSVTGIIGIATIRVTCDGSSDLGDHLVIARTNQTCHIPLLAGATYAVESDLPIEFSEVSSEYAEIMTNSRTRLTVSLPLEISFERVQMRSGPGGYLPHTSPIDVGPRISGISGGCCTCSTNDFGISWGCTASCSCVGEHQLSVVAVWEGYFRAFSLWEGCPCYYEEREAQEEIQNRGVSLEILDANGSAIAWKYPILVGEAIIVEATVGGSEMTVADFVDLFGGRIRLKAFYVDSEGQHDIVSAAIPMGSSSISSQGQNVFRVTVSSSWLQSSGIVRHAPDGIAAKTSIDMAAWPDGGSDRTDSDCFDATFPGRLYGRARGRWGGNPNAAIPEGEFNLKTVQAAGTACLVASCGTSCSTNKQCQQQADVLYYSGHGEHDTGRLYGTAVPTDVTNHWHDVDTVVFAGCAILDIGDRNDNYTNPTSHAASPGLKWVAASEASTLLGYAYTAPLDSQGSTAIIADWCAQRTALGDVEAWMRANDCRSGHNACAIRILQDGKVEYRYFTKNGRSWNLRRKYTEIVEEIVP